MEDYDRFMSIQSFYKDLFALVIDLRSIEDNMKHGTGKKIETHSLVSFWK